ncbi:hypothetical protein Ddc_10665 [Ditylenchus destructor]|nr:hypothetical protein Ddc_10665 [Ditylenchus destructor]
MLSCVVLLLLEVARAEISGLNKEAPTAVDEAPHQRRPFKAVHRAKRYGYGCGYCGGGGYYGGGGYPGFYGGYPGIGYGGYPGYGGYGPFGVGLFGVAGGLLFGGYG